MRFAEIETNALITLTIDVSRRVFARKINHKEVIDLASGEVRAVHPNKDVTLTPPLPATMLIGQVGGEVVGLVKISGGKHYEVIRLQRIGGGIVSAAEVKIMENRNNEVYIIFQRIVRRLLEAEAALKGAKSLFDDVLHDQALSLTDSTLENQKAISARQE